MNTVLVIGASIVVGFILGIISRDRSRGSRGSRPEVSKAPSSNYKGVTHRARGLPVWGTGNMLQVHGSAWDSRRRGSTGMIVNPEPPGILKRPRGTPPPDLSKIQRQQRDREIFRLVDSYLAKLQEGRGASRGAGAGE